MDENGQFLKIARIIAIPLAIVAFIIMHLIQHDCKKTFEEIRKDSWQYHIDTLYISSDHGQPLVFVTGMRSNNQMKHVGLGFDETRDLFYAASVGDSIYKSVGSLRFKLVKKDTVLFFYPVCDGEKMK